MALNLILFFTSVINSRVFLLVLGDIIRYNQSLDAVLDDTIGID